MTIRISGLNSGLDTDAIIKELVSAYSTKKEKYVKSQTTLSWKQDAWKAMNTKIYSLYTSIGSMRFSDAYSLKATNVSDLTKASVTASNSAVNGSYSLKISQMAKSGYLTGGKLDSSTTGNSTLGDLGYDGGSSTISVTSGGKTTDIAVDQSTTINDYVSQLNSAGVKASYDSVNQRIYVAASDTGVANDFSLTGNNQDGVKALTALGLNVASDANTQTYENWAAYAKNTSGESYYVLDADGKIQYDTDANGNKTARTNGTYDAAKTQAAIESYLAEVDDAENNASTGNAALKALNEENSTKITSTNAQIKYANAYASVNDALGQLDNAAQGKELTTLAAMSTADLQKSYVTDADGMLQYDEEGKLIEASADSEYSVKGSDRLELLEREAGLITESTDESGKATTDSTKAAAFIENVKTINAYEADEENADTVSSVKSLYTSGSTAAVDNYVAGRTAVVEGYQADIASNNEQIAANNAVIDKYSLISNGEDAAALAERISYATGITDGTIAQSYSAGATRIDAQDSIITLNGAEYTSSSNTYSINGLTIEALAETGDQELSVVTKTDTQGIYDKIKGMLKQYNELINEMTSLYNASSSSGYEPLTSDEKDAMTDTQIEEWEKKIKDSLFRRDSTLSGVMNVMENSMAKSFTIGGKTYSLSSFGIKTLGVLNATENQENAYHIDGDPDDTTTSGNADKLMAAINSDPESVVEFMKELTSGLYKELDGKMKSTTLSSAYTVYNDKQMSQEYSDYTTTIKRWDEKVTDLEDSYYKKFAAMESALATLQSSSSSLTSMLG